MTNNKDFHVPWGEAISYLVSPPGKTFAKDFCLSGDAILNRLNRDHVDRCLYQPPGWEGEIKHFFDLTTKNLLRRAGRALPPSPTTATASKAGREFEVDIVRDVIIPLNTRFVAELFGLPIKTAETTPHGVYTEHELYGLLSAMETWSKD